MPRQALVGYFDLCTGCEMCMLACSKEKYGLYSPKKSHIKISRDLTRVVFTPITCIQCDKAPYHDSPCMKSCPVDAIARDNKTNAVVISPEKCTGCRLCIDACPVGMIQFDEETMKASKCDLCSGEPACVQYCQFNALEYK